MYWTVQICTVCTVHVLYCTCTGYIPSCTYKRLTYVYDRDAITWLDSSSHLRSRLLCAFPVRWRQFCSRAVAGEDVDRGICDRSGQVLSQPFYSITDSDPPVWWRWSWVLDVFFVEWSTSAGYLTEEENVLVLVDILPNHKCSFMGGFSCNLVFSKRFPML